MLMSKKEKIFTVAFLLLAILSFAACQKKNEATEKYLRVGIVKYTQDDPFINAMAEKLRNNLKAMETKDIKIVASIKNGNDDQRDQNNVVEEIVEAGCDILCVNLVDRTAPSNIIRIAKQNDIPVIFFNREPVREDLLQWDKLYYVGCDAEQSGIIQGNMAAEFIKSHPDVDKNNDGKIQYVLIEGEAGHQDTISRTDFSVKTLMNNGIELEKLSYQFADWNRGQAENRMCKLIEQYNDSIELIISNNDEMALGAIEAYTKAGYKDDELPAIFGIDGLNDALETIKSGKMQGTVYNDKEDLAMKMAELALDIFKDNGEFVNQLDNGRYYTAEYKKVDGSNVDEYLSIQSE